jgi:hypothetical protein
VSRSSRRAEAARKKAAEKDFVHTAADRVGPLAQSAAEKVGPLALVAADVIGAAADKVSPIAHSAAYRVGPLAQTAADRVGPLAQSAADRIAPLAGSAVDRVGPYAERVAPLAAAAMLRGTQVRQGAVSRIAPVLDDAVGRVSPAVSATRDRVTGDLLPRLGVAWSAAAASPLVEEAGKRAEATLAAARGELTLPKKKGGSRAEAALAAAKGELTLAQPKPKRRWLKRVALIGGLAAVLAVVVRRFLGNQDADWQAARPTAPYVPPTPRSTSAPADTATDTAATAGVASDAAEVPPSGDDAVDNTGATGSTLLDQPAEGGIDEEPEPVVEEDFAATEAAPVRMLNVTDSGDVEETVVDEVVIREPVADLPETEPVSESPAVDQPTQQERARRWSGEGVYVGHEPPEGFVIKGNERSRKYHLPESAGYARTTGEVWFSSEEAAQQAGFVRAQR